MRRKYLAVLISISFVIGIKLNWEQAINSDFFSLDKCPSCYGLQCDQVLSDKFVLKSFSQNKIFNFLFNIKNVFYGCIGNEEIVLKKLAYNREFAQFDRRLCSAVDLPTSCDSAKAITTLVEIYNNNVSAVIDGNAELFERAEIIKCRHRRILPFLLERFGTSQDIKFFLTLLAVNSEPIMIKAFHGVFPIPIYFGACGRVIIEEFVGKPLSYYYEAPFSQRAFLALQLLRLADVLSENEIRIYITDPSSDNFAVDDKGILKLIDLENIVLVDSQNEGIDKSVHSTDGLGCSDCFSYDYKEICHHFRSDHNYFAVCKGLLSSTPFASSLPGGLLHTIPEDVLKLSPNLPDLIEECAQPKQSENRLEPASRLSHTLVSFAAALTDV